MSTSKHTYLHPHPIILEYLPCIGPIFKHKNKLKVNQLNSFKPHWEMQPIFFTGHQPSGLPHPVPFPSCSFSFQLLAYQLIYVYMSSALPLLPPKCISSLGIVLFLVLWRREVEAKSMSMYVCHWRQRSQVFCYSLKNNATKEEMKAGSAECLKNDFN